MDNVLRVVCLCADWCGVCREYSQVFAQLGVELSAQAQFLWIDVEDAADQLGRLDVENFPSLLIARGDALLFFGAVTPYVETLKLLVNSAFSREITCQDSNPALNTLMQHLPTWSQRFHG
jgi:thioredoxin 1